MSSNDSIVLYSCRSYIIIVSIYVYKGLIIYITYCYLMMIILLYCTSSSNSSSSSSGKKRSGLSVDQNEYGKYGIIKEEHFYHKQRYNYTHAYHHHHHYYHHHIIIVIIIHYHDHQQQHHYHHQQHHHHHHHHHYIENSKHICQK